MICPDCGGEAAISNTRVFATQGSALVTMRVALAICDCGSHFTRDQLHGLVALLAANGGQGDEVTLETGRSGTTFSVSQMFPEGA